MRQKMAEYRLSGVSPTQPSRATEPFNMFRLHKQAQPERQESLGGVPTIL